MPWLLSRCHTRKQLERARRQDRMVYAVLGGLAILILLLLARLLAG